MNAKPLAPLATLVATALIAACTGTSLTAVQSRAVAPTVAADARRIVDLPTVTVRPDPQDLAYYRASRIVDLATVTVRPEAEDLEFYLSSKAARMDDLTAAAEPPAPSKASRGYGGG